MVANSFVPLCSKKSQKSRSGAMMSTRHSVLGMTPDAPRVGAEIGE